MSFRTIAQELFVMDTSLPHNHMGHDHGHSHHDHGDHSHRHHSHNIPFEGLSVEKMEESADSITIPDGGTVVIEISLDPVPGAPGAEEVLPTEEDLTVLEGDQAPKGKRKKRLKR